MGREGRTGIGQHHEKDGSVDDDEDEEWRGGIGNTEAEVEEDGDEVARTKGQHRTAWDGEAFDGKDTLDAVSANAESPIAAVSVSTDTQILKRYATAGIALLSLNAILGSAAMVVGVLIYKKSKRAKAGAGRSSFPRYSSLKLSKGDIV